MFLHLFSNPHFRHSTVLYREAFIHSIMGLSWTSLKKKLLFKYLEYYLKIWFIVISFLSFSLSKYCNILSSHNIFFYFSVYPLSIHSTLIFTFSPLSPDYLSAFSLDVHFLNLSLTFNITAYNVSVFL